MKKYQFWQGPVLALFSKPFYASVAGHWKGIGMGYLLFLLALSWIPGVMRINSYINDVKNRELAYVLEQIPPLETKDGKMLTNAKLPYRIKLKDGTTLALIDRDAKFEDFDDLNTNILITEDEMIIKKNNGQKQVYSFSESPNLSLDSKLIAEIIDKALSIFKIVFYPLAVLNSFTLRLIQALIYALIGLIFASALNTKLEFARLFRLAVVASTAAIIYRTVVFYFGLHVPYLWLTGVVLTLIYLFIGISAADSEDETADYSDLEADPY